MRTKVCRASNLARNLARHNREEKCLDASTRDGAPYWEYVMVIGPLSKGHHFLAEKWSKAGSEETGQARLEALTLKGMKLGQQLSSLRKRTMLYVY
jgi:hypothetical protein